MIWCSLDDRSYGRPGDNAPPHTWILCDRCRLTRVFGWGYCGACVDYDRMVAMELDRRMASAFVVPWRWLIPNWPPVPLYERIQGPPLNGKSEWAQLVDIQSYRRRR